MRQPYTITTEPNPGEHAITLLLNGKFGEDALPALDDSLQQARQVRRHVYLDLSEVTLVDRKAVEYLTQQAMSNVELINCPLYLRRWIGENG